MRFEEYADQRRHALFRFAVVLYGDPVLADDIVADVLSTAFERWHQVDAADNVHAYVRRMVVNEYLGWRRRAIRTRARSDIADLLAPVADHADAHAEHAALAAELDKLPRKQRAALVLRYYEGLSFGQIGNLLGSGENAVRSNISRALRRLRVELTASEAETPSLTPMDCDLGDRR